MRLSFIAVLLLAAAMLAPAHLASEGGTTDYLFLVLAADHLLNRGGKPGS